MKNKILLFALSLSLFSGTVSAQRNDSRDRSREYQNNNDRDDDEMNYGPRRVRHDQDYNRRTMMSPQAFRQALVTIKQENFDSDRLKVARLIARRNQLSTAQIRSIVKQFSFDSSRLEFAKYAYASCVDPQNYYTVGKAFTFSSSRDELYDYIARV